MTSFEKRMAIILGDVSYKDWVFRVGHDSVGLHYLQVRVSSVRDEWHSIKWRLSIHMTDNEIVQTALKAVLTAEEHEARYRFLYRNVAIFGPHWDVEGLWDLGGSEGAAQERNPVTGARDGIEAQHGLNDTYPGDPYP